MVWTVLFIIAAAGATGGFVNVFLGDSGLHLPVVENGIFRPGFAGIMFIGALAALASWASLKAFVLIGPAVAPPTLSTSDIANGLLTGFGGSRWFNSEIDRQVLRKTAAIAASRSADQQAAEVIGSGTPMAALQAAINMR